jgi:hypothetical protein
VTPHLAQLNGADGGFGYEKPLSEVLLLMNAAQGSNLSNVRRGESRRRVSFADLFGAEVAKVKSRVLSLRQYFEIFWSVVVVLAIAMMHLFVIAKRPTDHFFSDKV